MRVATIDIGTNSVLLLIAEEDTSGELAAVDERATITRLGEDVDRTRALAPAAIERTNRCLSEYAEAVAAHRIDAVAVAGTSAMRDARGGEAVRSHVERLLGVRVRVLNGEEEARLTFAGAVSGLDRHLSRDEPVVVFDIGGGSTEVVGGRCPRGAERAEVDYVESFDVGSVRLTERHVRSDPPSAEERAAIERQLTATFAQLPSGMSAREPIGIAGTVTTLAAVSLGVAPYDSARIHGAQLPCDELRKVVDHLAALPLAERRKVVGLEPKRADVIVVGGLIALAFCAQVGASLVRVSDRGVRWGLAQEVAAGLRGRHRQ